MEKHYGIEDGYTPTRVRVCGPRNLVQCLKANLVATRSKEPLG